MVASVSHNQLDYTHGRVELWQSQNSLRMKLTYTELHYRRVRFEAADIYSASIDRKILRSFERWLKDLLEDELRKLRKVLKKFERSFLKEVYPKALAVKVLKGAVHFSKGQKNVIKPLKESVVDLIDEMIEGVEDLQEFLKNLKKLLTEGFDRWEEGGVKELEVYYEELQIKQETLEIELVA